MSAEQSQQWNRLPPLGFIPYSNMTKTGVSRRLIVFLLALVTEIKYSENSRYF